MSQSRPRRVHRFPSNITMMRLRGLMRKEALQIVRDPSSIAIAFLIPVLLLLLFGYGISLDAEHVPVGLVVEQPTHLTAEFTASFFHSRYFLPIPFDSMTAAEEALREHRVNALVWLREPFSEQIPAGTVVPVQVIVNGSDANTARLIIGYVEGATARWLERLVREGRTRPLPIAIEPRIWFNAEVRSRNFLVPGLVAVIMTLIGALLTALVMAREWERGTMEALMTTPVTANDILLGKIIPYFFLGTGGMVLSVVMAIVLFDVPFRGSFWVLALAGAIFLSVALGMGLVISVLAKNQFVAAQAAIIVTFLPAFLLSGFLFDIGSMPPLIQGITYIFAARYFVEILQSAFLAGTIWPLFIPNLIALLIMAGLFFGLCRFIFRKRLE